MDKKNLFQIGEVARMFHLSVGSLRHYEKAGLLHPEYIDPDSGYRYYSTKQFEVLNMIRSCRALGMPLEQKSDAYDRVFLILDPEDTYIGQTEIWPSLTCACLRFCGSHKDAPPYYARLLDFLDQHQFKLSGFSREITLIDDGITNDSSQFVTEIQLPFQA